MKTINYSGVDLLTSDSIANAAFTLAAALAFRSRSEGIVLPVIDDDGTVTLVFITLGHAIPMLVRTAPDDELEPEFTGYVLDIVQRTREVKLADQQ